MQKLTSGKPYGVQITCIDRLRSEADLLHRFVAQLKLPRFKIEKVDVCETPVSAGITFGEISRCRRSKLDFVSLFNRRRSKWGSRFKLDLSVNKLDRLGWVFLVEYRFEGHFRHGSPEKQLRENIEIMIEMAFAESPSFLVSPASTQEV